MKADFVQQYADLYLRTAPAVLGEQHKFLFKSIEKHLKSLKKEDKSLLVIGCSEWVLPFSYYPERVSSMMGKGKICLMDYTDERVYGAIDVLNEINYPAESGFRLNKIPVIEADPVITDARTILAVKGNVRDKLPFPNNSFDCIDANLVIHHATPYLHCLDSIASELFRVLSPGGMLHYGDGDVDMDSESKLIRIMLDLSIYFGKSPILVDVRDQENGYVTNWHFKDGKREFVHMTCGNGHLVTLSKEGIITVPTEKADALTEFLSKRGYSEVRVSGGNVLFPLIDPVMDKGFVEQVKEYYSGIWYLALANGCDDKLLKEFRWALNFEESNALKGVVEYYRGIGDVENSLKKAGFSGISKNVRKTGPFYSILAYKR